MESEFRFSIWTITLKFYEKAIHFFQCTKTLVAGELYNTVPEET